MTICKTDEYYCFRTSQLESVKIKCVAENPRGCHLQLLNFSGILCDLRCFKHYAVVKKERITLSELYNKT